MQRLVCGMYPKNIYAGWEECGMILMAFSFVIVALRFVIGNIDSIGSCIRKDN